MIQFDELLSRNLWIGQAPEKASRKLTVATVKKICCEERIKDFGEKYPHLGGLDFVRQLFEYLDFTYETRPLEVERIPGSGATVIIANHPLGSLDGLALVDLVARVRKDVKVVASELLWNVEPLRTYFLPVNNFSGKTLREDLEKIHQYLESGGAIIIFPAGTVSRLTPKGIRDDKWRPGFLRFAMRAQATIVPMQVRGRNSWWFYGLSMLYRPLSTLWLVREMFKQEKRSIELRVGEPVSFNDYSKWPLAERGLAKMWRRHVHRIHKRPRSLGPAMIAAEEKAEEVRAVVQDCTMLASHGKLQVVHYRQRRDCPAMRALARAREVSFRFVGEGTGKPRDWDSYDRDYDHLILWDREREIIAGGYRVLLSNQTSEAGLYTENLFDYEAPAAELLPNGAELGRSFLLPEYWGGRGLDLLWQGIGAWLRDNNCRYLFGAVTMPGTFSRRAKSAIARYYLNYHGTKQVIAKPKKPFSIDFDSLSPLCGNIDDDFLDLKDILEEEGVVLPPLFRKYTSLTERGGSLFHPFNIDPDFSDAVDALVIVDLERVTPKFAKRYLGKNAPEKEAPKTEENSR